MRIKLDTDEINAVNSLFKLPLIQHEKLVKYARNHGLSLKKDDVFDYDESTGTITFPLEEIELEK